MKDDLLILVFLVFLRAISRIRLYTYSFFSSSQFFLSRDDNFSALICLAKLPIIQVKLENYLFFLFIHYGHEGYCLLLLLYRLIASW